MSEYSCIPKTAFGLFAGQIVMLALMTRIDLQVLCTFSDSKIIISQTRLLWAFSYAHNLGFSSSSADYLDAAKSGYAFLQKNFFDQVHGGYYWSTDAKGNPVDKDKYQEGMLLRQTMEPSNKNKNGVKYVLKRNGYSCRSIIHHPFFL